jgi:hypothetical protein
LPQVDHCLAAVDTAAKNIQKGLVGVSSFNSLTFNPRTIGKTAAVVYLSNHLALRYDKTFKMNEGRTTVGQDRLTAPQVLKNWNANLKAWWLYDILTEVFIGSDAYTNAQRRVWESKNPGEDGKACTDMLSPPKLANMLEQFCELFVNEAGTEGEDSPAQRKKSLQTIALMHLLFPDGHDQDKIELDHVVPWTKVNSKIQRYQGIPLNHSANYMPIPKPVNGKRKNAPWATHIGIIEPVELRQTIRQRLLLPDALFTNEVRYDRKKFLEIMMRRWCLMIDQALIKANLNEWTELDTEARRTHLNDQVLKPAWTHLGYSKTQARTLLSDAQNDALEDLGQ